MYITTTSERESLAQTQRLTVHLRPVAYRRDGVLRAIDPLWGDGGGIWPHAVLKAPVVTLAGADGRRRLLPVVAPGAHLDVGPPYVQAGGSWTRLELGEATRAGNRLVWHAPEADLFLDSAGHAVKLGLLFRNGWQPPGGQVAFPFEALGLARQGRLLLADGVPVLRLRRPLVLDADNPADRRPVAWDVVQAAGGRWLLLTLPDLNGMSRPLLDPTYDVQPDGSAGQDVSLSRSAADENLDGQSGLPYSWAGGAQYTALFRFDLSGLPGGSSIVSGGLELALYTTGSGNPDTHTLHRLLPANSGWTEDGATWNTRDGTTAWAGTTGCQGAGVDYSSTPLGSLATTGAEPPDTPLSFTLDPGELAALAADNAGLLLRNADTQVPQARSSDHTDPTLRPRLTIVYTESRPGVSRLGIGI